MSLSGAISSRRCSPNYYVVCAVLAGGAGTVVSCRMTGSSGVAPDSGAVWLHKYWRFHLKTWLVLTSCMRAMRDTDAPGTLASCAILRLCSAVKTRRFGLDDEGTLVSGI
jgi:hypothetical protein